MGGGDKCLLQLAGRPLLVHAIDRVRPQAAPLLLNANGQSDRFAEFGLPVMADPVPDHPGPLAGILAGMRWAMNFGHSHMLSLPTDTPYFPLDLSSRLLCAVDPDHPIACAATAGAVHHVFAVWPVDLADRLETALQQGCRHVGRFAETAGRAVVDWTDRPFDPFFNINTPQDLAAAEEILLRNQAGTVSE
jgi:molybdopterin-guanine dinucleotide biosynthesis protein A